MTKTPLPPITDALMARPAKRPNLRDLKAPQSVEDRNVSENSRALGTKWGAQTSLDDPDPAMTSLRMVIPEYVDRQLSLKAAEAKVTKQYLVLKALAEVGYEVRETDLVEDKRKRRRR
ncbi:MULTISPECIES: hypothetical protein [Gluconobacter]|uniref:hypothetical protein n=1 Tax=Gluconobacter TaxID=441 RepID=UPI001B8B708C|nr:hypothetical protein [Gluconobacter cerinus]MBS1020125.1 hypothetical protein [Gluconobacter cerinus]MBS1038639.1 hypothetical protein [Gluconobacter cerinus]